MIGIKHVLNCRCILQQFKNLQRPPNHKFIVFSVISDNDEVVSKFVQCNNCGIVHKVIDIGKSEIIGKENIPSIITIDDIRASLPEKLIAILDANHNSDLPTWEAASFIIENKLWGQFVVLSSDEDDGLRQGKYVRILGENLFKVETFTREEVIKL